MPRALVANPHATTIACCGAALAVRANKMREAGTRALIGSLALMSEPLPVLIENVVQIAWDVLERSGEVADPHEASWFLVKAVAELARKGERRRLLLINRAIDAYRLHRRAFTASTPIIRMDAAPTIADSPVETSKQRD